MEKGFVYRIANVNGDVVFFVSFVLCNLGLEIILRCNIEKPYTVSWVKYSMVTLFYIVLLKLY